MVLPIIMRMRKQCVPGALSPPPPRLGTRLSSGSAVNSFFDQGKFETMKTLSGWEAARCDEHQFRAKAKVST